MNERPLKLPVLEVDSAVVAVYAQGVSAHAYLLLSDRDLLVQCEVTTYRASGPGGQKRNKTESAVRLKHRPSDVMVHADESRSQAENKIKALARLRQRIAVQVRNAVDLENYNVPEALASLIPGRRTASRPGRKSAAYAVAVQQLLDLFVANGCSVADSARCLKLSTAAMSQLLLDADWVGRAVNMLRRERGLRALR